MPEIKSAGKRIYVMVKFAESSTGAARQRAGRRAALYFRRRRQTTGFGVQTLRSVKIYLFRQA
jgi:hypothetical protein